MWTYDKIATDRIDTKRSIGGTIVVFGGNQSSSPTPADQRTLTLIIYYDEQKRVRDLAYNYSPL